MTNHSFLYRTLLSDELHAVQDLMLDALREMPSEVQAALALIIRQGGKQLRPALVLLSAHLYGAEMARALPVAAAVELLHTATLIHDDLIDNAQMRRGAETLNAAWSPAATVLAGDVAFAWAARLASRGGSLPLMERFAETLTTICSGELSQMFKRGALPTPDDYYARIFAKTASLFALASETGALLTDRDDAVVQRARRFGKALGEAFQIADDVLDLMGDPAMLGKPVGSDLRQGIVTLPALLYLEQHPTDARVSAAAAGAADEAALRALIADLRDSDAAARAMAQADLRAAAALDLLAASPSSPHRSALEEIVRFAVRREY